MKLTFEENWKRLTSFLCSMDDHWTIYYDNQTIGNLDILSNVPPTNQTSASIPSVYSLSPSFSNQSLQSILESKDSEKLSFKTRGESLVFTYPEAIQKIDAMKCREFQCILLAGGQGQGLYPISEFIPKPLLPIANKPLLNYPVKFLVQNGVKGKLAADLFNQIYLIYDGEMIFNRTFLS